MKFHDFLPIKTTAGTPVVAYTRHTIIIQTLVSSGKERDYGRYFWKALFWSYMDESHTRQIDQKSQVPEHIPLDTVFNEI